MVVASILGWEASVVQPNSTRNAIEIPGASLKWIHIAEPEFQRRQLDLDNYMVAVNEQADSVFVSVRSLDSIEGSRGSTGNHPAYEVEISKKDLKDPAFELCKMRNSHLEQNNNPINMFVAVAQNLRSSNFRESGNVESGGQ